MSIEEEEDASLKELVTRTLQGNGVLGKIQAQLRASVFLALEEEFREKNVPLVSQAAQQLLSTPEGSTAAALIHDFLHTLGLDFSLAVFAPESGHQGSWSLPPTESLAARLKLSQARKGTGVPLLVELVRERQGTHTQKNGEADALLSTDTKGLGLPSITRPVGGASISSADVQNKSLDINSNKENVNSKFLNPNKGEVLDVSPGDPKSNEENVKAGTDDNRPGDLSSHSEQTLSKSDKKTSSSSQPNPTSQQARNEVKDSNPDLLGDIDKEDTEKSVNDDEKQYEDDFSSMSEREGREEEEEEEVTEDIEEDLSLDDLINSSASGASENTKDQPLSQLSNPPDYQEDL